MKTIILAFAIASVAYAQEDEEVILNQRRVDLDVCFERSGICNLKTDADKQALEMRRARLAKRKLAMKEIRKYPATAPVSKTLIKNMEEAEMKQFFADQDALCQKYNDKLYCMDELEKKGWVRFYNSGICKAEREFQILSTAPKEKRESMLANISLNHDRSFLEPDMCPSLLAKDKEEIGVVPEVAPATAEKKPETPTKSPGKCVWVSELPRKILHGPAAKGCNPNLTLEICSGYVACSNEEAKQSIRLVTCSPNLCGEADAQTCAEYKSHKLEQAEDSSEKDLDEDLEKQLLN